MASLIELLAAQHVQLLEASCLRDDLDLLLTWQRLWAEFSVYVDIRDHMICEGGRRPFFPKSMSASSLVAHLVNVGLLKHLQGGFRVAGPDADRLLRGAWLEELGATIARDAGADEVRHSQKLSWESRYGGLAYQNEVDVLARFGERLVFVSCKALAPWATETPNGTERIFDAMKEVSYWRQHFGAGKGQAILLTTADFIDEARHRPRNAALLEHADVLGVRLVSADAGDFTRLVKTFRAGIEAA